jgi:hypothetical protein
VNEVFTSNSVLPLFVYFSLFALDETACNIWYQKSEAITRQVVNNKMAAEIRRLLETANITSACGNSYLRVKGFVFFVIYLKRKFLTCK